MLKIGTAVLLGVALVLVSVLATAAYFRATTSASILSVPAVNPLIESVDFPMASGAGVGDPNLALSDRALSARMDRLFERGQMREARALLQILNDRYEQRCCGLPR